MPGHTLDPAAAVFIAAASVHRHRAGDLTPEDIDAFLLQFGVYAGFPRASAFASTLKRVRDEIAAAGSA